MPSCPICDKVYVRESPYQRHVTVCKFMPPTAAAANIADEIINSPEINPVMPIKIKAVRTISLVKLLI